VLFRIASLQDRLWSTAEHFGLDGLGGASGVQSGWRRSECTGGWTHRNQGFGCRTAPDTSGARGAAVAGIQPHPRGDVAHHLNDILQPVDVCWARAFKTCDSRYVRKWREGML
jgi:hypothetical protein